MKQVAVIIIVLVIAAAAYLVFTLSSRQVTPKDIHPVPGLVHTNHETAQPEKSPDTVAVKELAAGEQVNALQEQAPAEPQPQPQPQTVSRVTAPPVENDGNYYIIIESFKNTKAAHDRATYLEKKLNNEIVVLPPTPAGIYRISYGRYATYEKADSALIKVRIKIRPEAWILSPLH